MAKIICCMRWLAAIAVALVSILIGSALICLGVPFGYGIAGDLATAAGPHGAAFACEVAAGVLVWRLWRRTRLAASDV
jgi:hypothetical protein